MIKYLNKKIWLSFNNVTTTNKKVPLTWKKRTSRTDTRDNIQTEDPKVIVLCGDSYLWFCLCQCDQCTSQHVVPLCFLQLLHINAATVWSLWKKSPGDKGRCGSGQIVGHCGYSAVTRCIMKVATSTFCTGPAAGYREKNPQNLRQ